MPLRAHPKVLGTSKWLLEEDGQTHDSRPNIKVSVLNVDILQSKTF